MFVYIPVYIDPAIRDQELYNVTEYGMYQIGNVSCVRLYKVESEQEVWGRTPYIRVVKPNNRVCKSEYGRAMTINFYYQTLTLGRGCYHRVRHLDDSEQIYQLINLLIIFLSENDRARISTRARL